MKLAGSRSAAFAGQVLVKHAAEMAQRPSRLAAPALREFWDKDASIISSCPAPGAAALCVTRRKGRCRVSRQIPESEGASCHPGARTSSTC